MNQKTAANRYYLGPGHVVITDKPSEIWMVLGSCVSLVFFDVTSGTAAACHAQLPSKKLSKDRCIENSSAPSLNDEPDPNVMKFLEPAFDYMIKQLRSRGIDPAKTRVSLLGGSNILQSKRENSIGELNITTARRILIEYGIKLSHENTGGNTGRTIIIDTVTGKFDIKMQRSVEENEQLLLKNPFSALFAAV